MVQTVASQEGHFFSTQVAHDDGCRRHSKGSGNFHAFHIFQAFNLVESRSTDDCEHALTLGKGVAGSQGVAPTKSDQRKMRAA